MRISSIDHVGSVSLAADARNFYSGLLVSTTYTAVATGPVRSVSTGPLSGAPNNFFRRFGVYSNKDKTKLYLVVLSFIPQSLSVLVYDSNYLLKMSHKKQELALQIVFQNHLHK